MNGLLSLKSFEMKVAYDKIWIKDFKQKSSNIDFLIKLLLQLGYELLLSEMQKKLGVTNFVFEIRYLKGHPNFEKSVFLTWYGSNVCMSKNIASELPIFKDPVLSIMLHAPLLLSLFARERGFYCFPGFCFSRGKHSIARGNKLLRLVLLVPLNLLY